MILYRTPDGRTWLYGGTNPVGITAEQAEQIRGAAVADVGELDYLFHSRLWAGSLTGELLEGLAVAIVSRVGPDVSVDELVAGVRALLTHPDA